MPNIQFDANADYWWKHKNLPPEKKREVNDKLRKALYKELDKIPDKKK